jgi:putative endopeptidase
MIHSHFLSPGRVGALALAMLGLTASVPGVSAQQAPITATPTPISLNGDGPPAHGLDLSDLDTSVNPCQDFYSYVNGKWIAATTIPPEYTRWGSFEQLHERNLAVLHGILDAAAADTKAKPDSVEGKVGRFYRVGMDTDKIEADGAKPLAPEFAGIAAVHDALSLQDEMAHLQRIGVGTVWGVGAGQDAAHSDRVILGLRQGGLSLPDRDYYLKDDDATKAIRTAYVGHISKMFQLLGDAPADADAEAQKVLALETQFAQVSLSRVERRDPKATYHPMTLAQVQSSAPGIDWDRYFAAIGVKNPGTIDLSMPKFFAAVGPMMSSVPMDDWKTYLRWRLISTEAGKLSSPFVNERFRFFGQTLSGAKELPPRWKQVEAATDGALGEDLGQLYVVRAFSPQAKARALAMVLNLKASLRDRIQTVDWMGPDTKKEALAKLDRLTIKVGYPDKWRDYSKFKVDAGTYVGNSMESSEYEFQRDLDKLGKPVDRTEWGMTPPTVNAYYNPAMNEIVFPAGILQPPFFDAKADDAVNYGGIGAVIGHEMTHGFDDQGRQFDSHGNLRDWWTAADAKNFSTRAQGIIAQYSGYEPLPELHLNGNLTIGENIADIGGVKIAYLALEKALGDKPRTPIDGFTPEQRFFLAFAHIWRETARPEAVRLGVATDPHSPGRFRVTGVLADTPEFKQAFHCPETTDGTAAISLW